MPSLLDPLLQKFADPRTLLGIGLTAASTLPKQQSGASIEAQQALRNQFNNPSGVLASNLQGLQQNFQPYLRQQENEILDNAQQRSIQGLPASLSTGMGGGEIQGIKDAITKQIIPQRQAFLAALASQQMDNQARAAQLLLGNSGATSSRGSGLSGMLGNIGGSLLNQGMGGNGQTGWGDIIGKLLGGKPASTPTTSSGVGGAEQLINQSFSNGGNGLGVINDPWGQSALAGQQAGEGQVGGQLSALLGGNQPFWTMQAGNGSGFFSPLATAGGLFQGAGTAGAGYFAGNMIGQQLPGGGIGGEGGAALAGGGGGALAGAALGTMIFPGIGTALGAMIGGLAGVAGGFFGSQSATQQYKAQRLSADLQSQGNNVGTIGSFWTEALGAAGFQDLDGWNQLVQKSLNEVNSGALPYSFDGISGTWDQPNNLITIGSRLLLQQIQKASPQISSLDQVPGFRDRYIQYLMDNMKIESKGSVIPLQNIGQAAGVGYLSDAGL